MKSFILKGVVALASLSLVSAQNSGRDKLPERYKFNRPIPINLTVVPSLTTNESVSQFHHALEKATGLLFDIGYKWLGPDTTWSRVAYRYILFPIVGAPINGAIRKTTALQGKASRLGALCGDVEFVNSAYEGYASNYWTLLGRNLMGSFTGIFSGGASYVDAFSVNEPKFSSEYANAYLQHASKVDLAELRETAERIRKNDAIDSNKVALDPEILKLRDQADTYLNNKGRVLVRAASYNAQMQHARYIEDILWYEGGGHMAQISNHAAHKLAHAIEGIGLFFARNDSGRDNSELGRISAAYQAMEIDLSWKMMGVHSFVAFLGSAEFWGRLFEETDYLKTGDMYIKAPEYRGVRLPNLGFFLTTSGPSYQVSTGYRHGEEWFFPLAVELVFQGPEKIVEATMGVRKKFAWKNTFLHAEIVINPQNKAAGGKLAMGMQPHENIFFDVGARFDHVNTLEGERNIRSLEKDTWCMSILASLGVMY